MGITKWQYYITLRQTAVHPDQLRASCCPYYFDPEDNLDPEDNHAAYSYNKHMLGSYERTTVNN
jgi:hypothetical protein